MSIYLIVCWAVLIAYTGCLLGLSIKLLNLKANIGCLILTPIIPVLACILLFIKRSSNRIKNKNFLERLYFLLLLEFKGMPLMCGIVCILLAESHLSALDIISIIITKGITYSYTNTKKRFQDIFNSEENEINCIINN